MILALAVIIVFACNNPKKSAIENPYAGAWEMTHSKYVYPDTTVESAQITNHNVKLLTQKHYAFGRQTGVNTIAGGGGEYSFKGDIFTSYPKYHTGLSMVGDSLVMKSKIEGDLWTISFSIKNDSLKVDATEIWKRIPE